VLTVLLGILLIGGLCWLVTFAARAGKRPIPLRIRIAQEWSWPTELLAGHATTIAAVVLLIGAVPVYGSVGELFQEGRLDRLPRDMRTAELRLFAPQVAEGLRELPTGSVVLADPRSRNGYMAMALAPLYAVSSVPRHTAFTPENRVPERFARAVSFIDGDFTKGDGLTADERIDLLIDEEVDAIILHPKGAKYLHRLLQSTPGIRVAGKGTNQWLYVVDRDRLCARPGFTTTKDAKPRGGC
ncbi:MAG: hypothetical protein JWM86_2783, partial [Thermoleophilia bacterium]|nr:hypothetical protein [Thermoleophilia bacterium]